MSQISLYRLQMLRTEGLFWEQKLQKRTHVYSGDQRTKETAIPALSELCCQGGSQDTKSRNE
jgi:hypothetical protein